MQSIGVDLLKSALSFPFFLEEGTRLLCLTLSEGTIIYLGICNAFSCFSASVFSRPASNFWGSTVTCLDLGCDPKS